MNELPEVGHCYGVPGKPRTWHEVYTLDDSEICAFSFGGHVRLKPCQWPEFLASMGAGAVDLTAAQPAPQVQPILWMFDCEGKAFLTDMEPRHDGERWTINEMGDLIQFGKVPSGQCVPLYAGSSAPPPPQGETVRVRAAVLLFPDTGLVQVYGRSDRTPEQILEEYDLEDVRHIAVAVIDAVPTAPTVTATVKGVE